MPVHRGRNNARTQPFGSLTLPLILAVCLAALPLSSPAFGQAFKFQGGASSLFGGYGGSVEIRGLNYTNRIGFGFLNGHPRYGIYYATSWRDVLWGAGDQDIPFTLPTDIFDRSSYFLGRGVSAAWKNDRQSFFMYGGATSVGFSTPFLNLAEAKNKTALLFYERKLTPSLRFFSRNVLASRQTSLQSLEWAPSERLRMAFTGGIGNNQRYWAGSFSLDKKWIEVDAAYSRAGDAFRRIRVEAPSSTETDRENIRIALKPLHNLQFSVSRQNYLAPLQSGAASERATVNSFSAWTSLRGLQLHGSFYDSSTESGRARGLTVGGRRNWFNRVETGVDLMRSVPSSGPAFLSIVSTVREHITPRISLSQVITTGNGQTYVSFGGTFASNRLSVGLEYQTIFLPFETSSGSPFKQVLAVNLRLRLWGGVEINGASDVTPLGKVRYTAYATGFAYRGAGFERSSVSSGGGAIYDYVIRGRVVENGGGPVRGAAVKIDDDLVFTDSQGFFLLRRKKSKESELSVALDQFVLPGNYAVITAPATVKAGRAESVQLYEIVLKRLRNLDAKAKEEAKPRIGYDNGTNAQINTVLEGYPLPLTRPLSISSILTVTAPGMPLIPLGVDSRHVQVTHNSKIPVGSYYLYPASGGAPIDLGAVKVRPAERGGQRRAGGASSGKR